MGLLTPAFTDYEVEAEPALDALRAGHVGRFLRARPRPTAARCSSARPSRSHPGCGAAAATPSSAAWPSPACWRRAPWPAPLSRACAAAGAGARAAAPWAVLLLAAANPLTLRALEVGHPEELLVTALSSRRALLALDGRPARPAPGVLLGLAVAGKPWAVLAVVPVLALLPTPGRGGRRRAAGRRGRRARCPSCCRRPGGAVGGAADAGLDERRHLPAVAALVVPRRSRPRRPRARRRASSATAPRPAGSATSATRSCSPRPRPGRRRRLRPAPPHRAADATPCCCWRCRAAVRCLLDTWNTSYYALPFLLALLTWEVRAPARARRCSRRPATSPAG